MLYGRSIWAATHSRTISFRHDVFRLEREFEYGMRCWLQEMISNVTDVFRTWSLDNSRLIVTAVRDV
jgi:hypothetical protein